MNPTDHILATQVYASIAAMVRTHGQEELQLASAALTPGSGGDTNTTLTCWPP